MVWQHITQIGFYNGVNGVLLRMQSETDKHKELGLIVRFYRKDNQLLFELGWCWGEGGGGQSMPQSHIEPHLYTVEIPFIFGLYGDTVSQSHPIYIL